MDSNASSGTVVDAFDGLSPSQRIARLEALLRQSRAETQRFRDCFELGEYGKALVGLEGRFLEVKWCIFRTGRELDTLARHVALDLGEHGFEFGFVPRCAPSRA